MPETSEPPIVNSPTTDNPFDMMESARKKEPGKIKMFSKLDKINSNPGKPLEE